MKTNFQGTMDSYLKIFEIIEKVKDEVYDLGHAISDMNYFVSSEQRDKIYNERSIYHELDNRLSEVYRCLNDATGENRRYDRFRNK